MAKFTCDIALNLRWNGNDIVGPPGTVFRIPDALKDEFTAEVEGGIDGTITWTVPDEMALVPILPLAESDVTSLTTDLAAKVTNPMTIQDDLVIGGVSGMPTRLGKGLDGQVLAVDPTTHHLAWGAPSGFGADQIVNGSFESGFTGWTNSVGAPAVIDTSEFVTGAQSCKFGPSVDAFVSQTFDLYAGHTYTLVFWVRESPDFTTSSEAAVVLEGNASYGGTGIGVIPFDTWTKFSQTWLQATDRPGQDIVLSPSYGGGSTTGSIWFDTVSLVDQSSIPESNVMSLTTDLAGKAAVVHTHAESDVTSLPTDLAGKLPLAGGTLSGNVTGPAFLAKGVPWFDVKAYGAVGNGTTDDTAAINAAIAAAPAGGVVYFPVGTYKITSVVTITGKMLTLQGPSGFSEGATLSQATANTGALSFDQTADGSTVRSLRLLGNGAQTTSAGLLSQKSINCYDVRVESFYDGIAIGTVGSFYSRIVDCYVANNADINIRLYPATYNTLILGCRVQGGGVTTTGIYLDNNSVATRIISCSVEQHTTHGIRVVGGSNTWNIGISDCYFETAFAGADLMVGLSGVVDAVRIESCYFAAGVGPPANLWHINLQNVTNCRVASCYVNPAGAGGGSLTVGGSSSGIVFDSNDFAGVTSLSSGAKVTLSNGTVYATGHAPISANIGATTTVVCTTAGTWYKHTGWGDVPFVPAFTGQRWLIFATVTFQSNVASNILLGLRLDNDTAGTINAWQNVQQQNVPTTGKNQSTALMAIFTAAAGDVGANRYPYLYFQSGANATTVTLYGGSSYTTYFTAVPIP